MREAVLRSYMRGKGERQAMGAFGLLRDELGPFSPTVAQPDWPLIA